MLDAASKIADLQAQLAQTEHIQFCSVMDCGPVNQAHKDVVRQSIHPS